MASNIKYLDDNSFGGFDLRVTSNGMNESYVIQNDVNMINLVNFLISPPILPSLFITPRDWLGSLQIFPFNVNVGIENPNTGTLRVGGVIAKTDGGSEQDEVKVEDCYSIRVYNLGEYKFEQYFNNFADYNGYTKIQLFLPMYGLVEILPNDVMNKYLQIRLTVDVVTGMGVYYICTSDSSIPLSENLVTSDDSSINRILATYSCQLGYNIPIGSSDAPQVYRNIIGGAVKAIGGAVMSYAMATPTTVSTTTNTTISKGSFTRTSPTTGRKLKDGTWTRTDTTTTNRETQSVSYQKNKAITECFNFGTQALNNMHVSANSDRVNNPSVLARASESVHIIISRPKFIDIDEEYNKLYGQPLGETRQLYNVHGYTEVSRIHFEGSGFGSATNDELARIQDEFSKGVILP